MKLKKKGSKIYLVNLLADFILKQINPIEKSIISVTDFNNFYVVKGKTTSKEIINLSEILSIFKEEYSDDIPNNKNINTIDLIEYGCELKNELQITHTYYNSENCSYSQRQLDFWEEFTKESLDEIKKILFIFTTYQILG